MQSIDTLENEEWRQVIGYEGLYEVSSLGRVRTKGRTVKVKIPIHNIEAERTYPARIISSRAVDKKHKYQQCTLYKEGKAKQHLVHRLVAQSFIENPDSLPEVNHKDRNPENNQVTNLEWTTRIENMQDAMHKGYDPGSHRRGAHNSETWLKAMKKIRSVPCMCVETGVEYPSMAEAERQLGLKDSTISGVIDTKYAIHKLHFKRVIQSN